MKINYCCLISKSDKVLLAEYPQGGSNWMRINNLLNKIYTGTSSSQINIENNIMVSYIRTPLIIFVCVSTKNNDDNVFLQSLINSLKTEYNSLEKILENKIINKLCLQPNIGPFIDKFMHEHNMEERNNKFDETFDKNFLRIVDNINEPLVNNSITMQTYKEPKIKNKNKCIKITVIVISIILILVIIAYILISFIRCGNFYILCD